MNYRLPDRDTQFFSRHPVVFRNLNCSANSCMFWGLGVNNGWLPMLDDLCEQLADVIQQDDLSNFEVLQIKEKFGGLRFYAQGANEAARELIDSAERLSFSVCEECGRSGNTHNTKRSGIQTLCDECVAAL